MSHCLHILFPGKEKSTEESQAKSAKKQEDRNDAKPLDAIYRLEQVFVHDQYFLALLSGVL
jgi:hypothetical protein